MAHHAPNVLSDKDKASLGEKVWPLYTKLMIAALVGLIVMLVSAPLSGGGWDRLGFAYLIAYAFALSITLGSLAFVIITTVFRAGWCVAFRRLPETLAANMPTLGVLSIPVIIFAIAGNGSLYPWTAEGIHEAGREMLEHSAAAPNTHTEPADGKDAEHGDDAGHSEEAQDTHADAEQRFFTASESEQHATDQHHGEDAHGEHDGAAHGEGHDAHAGGHHLWTHTGDTWGDHDHATPYFVAKKGPWYTGPFWVIRWIGYIAIWSVIGIFYWKRSIAQDHDGDLVHTHKREWWAPLSIIAFGITITLAAFDLILSLDPVWYSTMYGVYFFAGCFTAAISTMIIVLMLGQKAGYFASVNTDHFHDLGKLLFAFVFFWGYTGFSQFMLIWYASLPETTYFWEIMGVTSVSGDTLEPAAPTFGGPWSVVAWTMLFAHLLLPFAILLSKHMKRNRTVLFTMACWMLTLCYLDLFWFIMPRLSSPELFFGLPEIGAVVFCLGVVLAEALRRAKDHSITAYNDPRMHESLGLDTTAWAPIYHSSNH